MSKKTTCLFKYRTHVPYGWIAVTFCSMDFSGYNSDYYQRKYRDLAYGNKKEVGRHMRQFKSDNKHDEESLKQKRTVLENLKNEKNPFNPIINTYRWRLWREQQREKISDTEKDIKTLENRLDNELENEDTALKYDCEEFLESNGFVRMSVDEKECNTYTEMWVRDEA